MTCTCFSFRFHCIATVIVMLMFSISAFKIYFPCTGKRTGEAILYIDIQFFGIASKLRSLPPIHIPLKRMCVAGMYLCVLIVFLTEL